jgi:LuxR family transcriptional regulator, maltose regulon positive regulatory protein
VQYPPLSSALPRLPKATTERTRLLERLTEARRRTCVLLQGPAGCGKTTLALQWRARLVGLGYDFAWVTVSPDHEADPPLLGLCAALDLIDPAIVREAAFIHNRQAGSDSSEAIAIPLLTAVARHPRELVILIDDCQNLRDSRAYQLLQMLLDFAPPNLHVAIVSRSMPALSLARLRARDASLELDFHDLRFTFSEAEEFLRARNEHLSRRDARICYDQTDGWVAGLQLLSLRPRLKEASGGAPVQNARDFDAYFSREVLAGLDPQELDSLARLAVARRFDVALCSVLLDPERGQLLFEKLLRENLFLVPVEAGRGAAGYRFHPLFRDLLLARFEILDAAVKQQTHAVLGDWSGRRGQLQDAVRHCIAAGDVERAADWVEQGARAMFLKGELRRMVGVVAELPGAVLASRVSLRLWVGWTQLCHRQLARCHETVEAMKATLPQEEDARHHLTLLEGSLAIQDDDTAQALALLPRIEAMPPAEDAILSGGRRNILAWLYTHLRDFERARDCVQKPALLVDGAPLLDSAFGALTGRCMLGFSYLFEGDICRAERSLRETMRDAEQLIGPYCEPASNAAGLLCDVLYETNDLAGLRELLDARLDGIEQVALPDTLLRALVMQSRSHFLEGSHQEASADLARLEDQAQQRGLDRVVAHALAERARLHLALGQLDAAEEALAAVRFVAKRSERRASAARDKIATLGEWTAVRCLSAQGRHHDARLRLQALMAVAPYRGQRRIETQMALHLALLEDALGHRPQAMRTLASALQMCQELGLVRSVLDHGPDMLGLAERTRDSGLLNNTISFYLEHVNRGAAAAVFAAPTVRIRGVEPLSERELDILRALASAMPNKRIALVLGISPETVKWHLKNIYGKLGVSGRDGAVARSRDLGWLDAG